MTIFSLIPYEGRLVVTGGSLDIEKYGEVMVCHSERKGF